MTPSATSWIKLTLWSVALIALMISYMGSVFWADHLVGARLSQNAQHALSAGRNWLLVVVTSISGIVDPRRTRQILAIPVDGSGNRALQASSKIGLPTATTVSTRDRIWGCIGIGIAALLATFELESLGDRAVGFLVGIGVAAVVSVGWATVALVAYLLIRLVSATTPDMDQPASKPSPAP
jgi:hypothetical protein